MEGSGGCGERLFLVLVSNLGLWIDTGKTKVMGHIDVRINTERLGAPVGDGKRSNSGRIQIRPYVAIITYGLCLAWITTGITER